MIDWHNGTAPGQQEDERSAQERSECVLAYIPVIYYSALLCVGVPVNILTLVALYRLAVRTQKALYVYLLALTGSDILSQLFIIFVGFLLETAVFHRDVPVLLLRSISYPARARRIIAVVFTLALASGVPFFWWSDMWRVSHAPNSLDTALIWTHVTIIYFLPCCIFLVLNSLIILRLRKRQRQQMCKDESGQQLALPGKLGKTTAMLLAVTSVFAILWAPRTGVVLYHLYVSSVHHDWRVHLAYDLANMLAMLNTAVNFFLYCFVSKPFRAAVRDVLLFRGGPLHPRRPLHQQRNPANASTSSISSTKRSQREITPLSPKRADIKM